MKEQDIDKLFKDKLANHKQIPPLQTWEKINAKLNQKKRRAVILWRMAAGVTLVAGASLVSYAIFTSKIDNENGIAISKNTNSSSNNIATNQIINSQTKVYVTNNITEITKNNTKKSVISNNITKITVIAKTNKINKTKKTESMLANSTTNNITTVNTLNNITNNVIANTVIDLPKNNTITNPIINTDSSKMCVNSENVIEVIVKLDSRMTKLDSNLNEDNEVLAVNEPKKRTLFGKIWQKVKEGETVTLRDVGVTAEKLPKFLRRN